VNNVVVYATEECPLCDMLIKRLDENNIKFEKTLDVNKVLDLGFKGAPVLEIDDNFVNFKDAMAWAKLVGDNNGL